MPGIMALTHTGTEKHHQASEAYHEANEAKIQVESVILDDGVQMVPSTLCRCVPSIMVLTLCAPHSPPPPST